MGFYGNRPMGPGQKTELRMKHPRDAVSSLKLPLTIMAIGLISLSAGVHAEPIEDVVRTAIQTHPTVLAAAAVRDSSFEGIAEARAALFPTLDLRSTAGGARTNNSTTRGRTGRLSTDGQSEFMSRFENSLTFSQLLFDGAGTRNRVEAARARLGASSLQLLDTGEQLALRAATAYLDVARNRILLNLAEANVAVHENILNGIRIKAEAGGGSEADVSQAEARLAFASATINQLSGALQDSEAIFQEAVGRFPEEIVKPPPLEADATAESVETVVADAIAHSPTVKAAAATLESRRRDYGGSKSQFLPRVTFDLGGTRNENAGGVKGLNNDFTAQIVMTYNIFRGGGDSARRRSSAALVREAIQREGEARRTVEVTTRVSFHALTTARDQLPAYQQQVASSEEVVSAYRQQFTLGERSLLDLLDVENELFQSRVALTNGEFGILLAFYRVQATSGRLLEFFGIEENTENQD